MLRRAAVLKRICDRCRAQNAIESDNIYTIRDLLNQENTDKTRYYDVFQVHGSYKQ